MYDKTWASLDIGEISKNIQIGSKKGLSNQKETISVSVVLTKQNKNEKGGKVLAQKHMKDVILSNNAKVLPEKNVS